MLNVPDAVVLIRIQFSLRAAVRERPPSAIPYHIRNRGTKLADILPTIRGLPKAQA
jgi:hypothetical protein